MMKSAITLLARSGPELIRLATFGLRLPFVLINNELCFFRHLNPDINSRRYRRWFPKFWSTVPGYELLEGPLTEHTWSLLAVAEAR